MAAQVNLQAEEDRKSGQLHHERWEVSAHFVVHQHACCYPVDHCTMHSKAAGHIFIDCPEAVQPLAGCS